jgi:hypothetical protein
LPKKTKKGNMAFKKALRICRQARYRPSQPDNFFCGWDQIRLQLFAARVFLSKKQAGQRLAFYDRLSGRHFAAAAR